METPSHACLWEALYIFIGEKNKVFASFNLLVSDTKYATQVMELSVDYCCNVFYFQIRILKVLEKN